MTARRFLTMGLTVVAAAGAGYGLLGLRAPKQVSLAPLAASRQVATQTIFAIGPDGRLYAIEVPYSGGAASPVRDRGGYSAGDGRRRSEEGGSYFENENDE